ncbi:MAG: sodium:proton antiporter [Vicinamibacterales bacterium]
MTIFAAVMVSIVFGCSIHLLLGRDLVRMTLGVSMLSSAINLFVMFCGLMRGSPPIHPLESGQVSDPVVQALTLTSVVISGGVSLLILGLLYRVAMAERTLDARCLERAEIKDESALEREARW